MEKPRGISDVYFNALIDHLENLSYRDRLNFLRDRVTPRLDRFLYKFRSLVPSEAKSVERMRDILVRCRLRLSSPAEFNDPFDMSANIVVRGKPSEIRRRVDKILEGQGIRWAQRKKRIAEIMSRADPEGAFLKTQETFEKTIAGTGVCSFAGDPLSILMWSHYAANHEGVCLQFELARDPRTFAQALPVDYNDDYPVVNWLAGMDDTTPLLRKHTGWKYERERRIIIPESAGTFIDFRPTALSGIITGYRASDLTVKRLRDLLTERLSSGFPLPKLYRAIKHKGKYRLLLKKEGMGSVVRVRLNSVF